MSDDLERIWKENMTTWTILYSHIWLEGQRKITKTQNNWCPGQYSNRALLEWESRTSPTSSVYLFYYIVAILFIYYFCGLRKGIQNIQVLACVLSFYQNFFVSSPANKNSSHFSVFFSDIYLNLSSRESSRYKWYDFSMRSVHVFWKECNKSHICVYI
jgi:hypothetical protein